MDKQHLYQLSWATERQPSFIVQIAYRILTLIIFGVIELNGNRQLVINCRIFIKSVCKDSSLESLLSKNPHPNYVLTQPRRKKKSCSWSNFVLPLWILLFNCFFFLFIRDVRLRMAIHSNSLKRSPTVQNMSFI